MALVKTSKISPRASEPPVAPAPSKAAGPTKPRTTVRKPGARSDTLSERVAAATEELASGLAEASAAGQQLRGSMEQIASGAEEAAGVSQEQLAGIKRILENLRTARGEAEISRRRTDNMQTLLAETSAQIRRFVGAVERNSQRQAASVKTIVELDRRAKA